VLIDANGKPIPDLLTGTDDQTIDMSEPSMGEKSAHGEETVVSANTKSDSQTSVYLESNQTLFDLNNEIISEATENILDVNSMGQRKDEDLEYSALPSYRNPITIDAQKEAEAVWETLEKEMNSIEEN
jgi:uncharacterized protein with HEPN domain